MRNVERPLPYSYAKSHQVLLRHYENSTNDAGSLATSQSYECLYTKLPETAVISELTRYTHGQIVFTAIEPDQFQEAMTNAYREQSELGEGLNASLSDSLDLQKFSESIAETHDLLSEQNDAPIIRLLNAILTEAVTAQASDIHIEVFQTVLSVRFRIDGALRNVFQPPQLVAKQLASRVKVMARLNIAEKRLPQDGRMAVHVAGKPVDIRVSTMPTNHGERIVLRLLEKKVERLSLENLGASQDQCALLHQLLSSPHGMLLVTGPTGSGKTTTLYAALSHLNTEDRNVLTIEDPVEYDLEGIGQTQVEPKIDMTFARGLRAVLRQDPDVVMVGEIRDHETAEIAIRASMTGHLVLSTLHTNTAVGAITRMIDLGVEPFLLSDAIVGVIAQRLVRVLCDTCKQPDNGKISVIESSLNDTSLVIQPYKASGCSKCYQTGYRGRTAIYEIIRIGKALRQDIVNGATEAQLQTSAQRFYPTLQLDGYRKVANGITSYEEVMRISSLSQ